MKSFFKSLLFGTAQPGAYSFEVTYALFRFYCGISMAIGAGLSKVFHKIDENGSADWSNLAFGVPDWFVKQVSDIGFTFISPSFWAHVAVYGEFVGGLLVALGLLTRISALQMAFQFFVVSFIWYNEPMPFAMYYQQLIFWCFVLIAATGGGRFSVDYWLKHSTKTLVASKKMVMTGLLLGIGLSVFGQSSNRVAFTVANPSLQERQIDIRYFDQTARKSRGYGYDLAPLSAHAVNMPAGTRVYRKQKGEWSLAFVVTDTDNGRKFDMTRQYAISPEQYAQAARDEQHADAAKLSEATESLSLETEAAAHQLEMVSFKIAGKTPYKKELCVRAQLPYDNQKSNLGFRQKLNQTSAFEVSYPAGTKLYRCDGPYWERDVPETYLFTVAPENRNLLIKI